MKNLIPLMALALVLLFGCNKEETNPASADNQQVEESSVSAYLLFLEGDSPVWEAIPPDELQSNSGTAVTSRSNSVHTHGDFTGFGSYQISWSGTENNGGTHGTAELYKSSSSGIFHFIFETECIMADGNEVVYGGTITEVIEKTGGPPIQVGWHYYWKVIDNGQGANAPADLNGNVLVVSPNSYCGVYTPDHPLWGIVGTSPVIAPGSVKVNN